MMRGLRWLLLGALGLAYLVLGYIGSAMAHPPLIALLTGFVPMVVLAGVAAWHSRWRVPLLLMLAAAVSLLVWHLAWLRDHAAWMFFLQHAGAMGLLTVTFGATLWGSHADALCSRVAMMVVPQQMDAEFLRYTWRVTLAWAVFFALMALASVALFFAGSGEAWALLATVATPILVLAMFAVEYLIRLRALPNRPHLNMWQTIAAYRQHQDQPTSAPTAAQSAMPLSPSASTSLPRSASQAASGTTPRLAVGGHPPPPVQSAP